MAYGDTTRARETSGNPSTTTVSAASMTQAVAYGDSMVNTFTGKSDWTSSNVEYASVQSASEYFASSYVRERFKDEGQKSKDHFERAMEICRLIRMGEGVTVVTQTHRTYPLNPDATPYRSISGGNNSTDDSDL